MFRLQTFTSNEAILHSSIPKDSRSRTRYVRSPLARIFWCLAMVVSSGTHASADSIPRPGRQVDVWPNYDKDGKARIYGDPETSKYVLYQMERTNIGGPWRNDAPVVIPKTNYTGDYVIERTGTNPELKDNPPIYRITRPGESTESADHKLFERTDSETIVHRRIHVELRDRNAIRHDRRCQFPGTGPWHSKERLDKYTRHRPRRFVEPGPLSGGGATSARPISRVSVRDRSQYGETGRSRSARLQLVLVLGIHERRCPENGRHHSDERQRRNPGRRTRCPGFAIVLFDPHRHTGDPGFARLGGPGRGQRMGSRICEQH